MNRRCYGWILPLLLCLMSACDDDKYHYPSVKLEFMTAFAGADGSLRSVLTDEGENLSVVEDRTNTRIDANASARIISNYALERAADGGPGARLYALSQVISGLPRTADKFEEGVKTDPLDVLSIWMGLDYLNMTLEVKEGGKHTLDFVEDEVTADAATGCCDVCLTLYHEVEEKVASYTRRVYASLPLRQYAAEGVRNVTVHLSVHTYSGNVKTYNFDYIPE